MKKSLLVVGVLLGALAASYRWRVEKPAIVPVPARSEPSKTAVAAAAPTQREAALPAPEMRVVRTSAPVRKARHQAPPEEAPAEFGVVRDNLRLQDVLPGLSAPPGDWRMFVPEKLTVCPLPGLPIEFEAKKITTDAKRTIWVGEGGDQGVTLVASGTRDRWDAIVTIPGMLEYNIEISAAGVRIVEKDFGGEICGAFSGDRYDFAFSLDQPAQDVQSPQFEADATALTSDLLILYTTAVKNSLGGADAVENQFAARIATANTYLAQSEVANIQWRLVGTVETTMYTESGNLGDDFKNLVFQDTQLSTFAAQQRDLLGADQVMLVVNSSDGSLAGGAGIPTVYVPEVFALFSFSAITRSVSAGTVAHELAHNFGCRHDRQQSEIERKMPPGGLDNDRKYNYGHRYNNQFGRDTGTIMSYAPSFRRYTYFSNPNVILPDGNPSGVAAGEPRAADNARLLRENAGFVAEIRPSGGWTMPVITGHPASVTLTTGQSFTLSVTATGNDLIYQWAQNGVSISGAMSSSYTKVNSVTTDSGTYTVTVSNPAGSVQSDAATVTVNPAPQPAPPPSSGGGGGGGGGGFDVLTILALLAVGCALARSAGQQSGPQAGHLHSLTAHPRPVRMRSCRSAASPG